MKKLMFVFSMVAVSACLVGCSNESKYEGLCKDVQKIKQKVDQKEFEKQMKKDILKFKEMKPSEQEEAMDNMREILKRAEKRLKEMDD